MTNRQMDNRVKKLQDIEAQIKILEKQAEAIKDELKAELGNFIIRWKEVISNRFDSKALKSALPDVYALYTKETSCRRFTVA